MSHTELVKAELRARRSARELEHGLDHLGVKLEEGAVRAQELKSRAKEVVSNVRHPVPVIIEYLSGKSREVSGQGRLLLSQIPPDLRLAAAGTAVFGVIATFLLVVRNRQASNIRISHLPSETVRADRRHHSDGFYHDIDAA
jgi:hypothetical protein